MRDELQSALHGEFHCQEDENFPPEIMARLAPTEDQLSFICWLNEWCLVRLAFQDTLAVHPDCVRNGKFLMDFLSATTRTCATMRQIRGPGCSTIDGRRLLRGRIRVASGQTFARMQGLVP